MRAEYMHTELIQQPNVSRSRTMRNSTHIARIMKACDISIEQLLSFANTSKHLTTRQREYLQRIGGAA